MDKKHEKQIADLISEVKSDEPFVVGIRVVKKVWASGCSTTVFRVSDGYLLMRESDSEIKFNFARKEMDDDYDRAFLTMLAYYCVINNKMTKLVAGDLHKIKSNVPGCFKQAWVTMDRLFGKDEKLTNNKKSIYMKFKNEMEEK